MFPGSSAFQGMFPSGAGQDAERAEIGDGIVGSEKGHTVEVPQPG